VQTIENIWCRPLPGPESDSEVKTDKSKGITASRSLGLRRTWNSTWKILRKFVPPESFQRINASKKKCRSLICKKIVSGIYTLAVAANIFGKHHPCSATRHLIFSGGSGTLQTGHNRSVTFSSQSLHMRCPLAH
jgi:hypothetical protein